MKRLKSIFKRAAVLLAGGVVVVGIAVQLASEQEAPPMKCTEWDKEIAQLADPQRHETFFVALKDDKVTIPKWHKEGLLGSCAAGVCTISRADCKGVATWTYDLQPSKDARKLLRVRCPVGTGDGPNIAAGLKLWADDVDGVDWLGGLGQVHAEAERVAPGADLAAKASDCWLEGDGSCCRYGLRQCLPGTDPRLGQACSPSATAKPMPCVVSRGAGSEMTDVAKTWTSEELSAAAVAAKE